MKKNSLIFIFVLVLTNLFGQKTDVAIDVHPGVELLTIIQKLADQFPNSSPSSYEKEVSEYFGKFKNHKAVENIKNFKGNVYPDLTELGFCFSDFPNFTLNIPDSLEWYKYYGKDTLINYLKNAKDFANTSNFWNFYNLYHTKYLEWGNTIKLGIEKDSLIQKLHSFYKTNSAIPKFQICLDPLNGWGAHAIPNPEIFNPVYAKLKAYTIGFISKKSNQSQDPVFKYGSYATNLIWHEGSHIYLEELFKKYKNQIETLSYLFNANDQGMKSQNISNWYYCLNENVVRGIVIALFKKYKTQREWKKQNAQEIIDDFIYAEDISIIITNEYLNSKKHKNFDTFFPILLDKLKKLYPNRL